MLSGNLITNRSYRYLVDFEPVYQFMLENYSIDGVTGQKPPFFEYAQTLLDFDREHTYLDQIWEDQGHIVAFCYYELSPGQVYINRKKGYDFLIPEVISYAEQNMRFKDGKLSFCTYNTQVVIEDELKRRGYRKGNEWPVNIFDLEKPMRHGLPDEFHFVAHHEIDYLRLTQMIWRSFGSSEWQNKDATGAYLQQYSPHQTKDLDVVIAAQNGDYACFAGMWLVPEVHLAYLEPLCTAPEYRNKGLASAALSELCRMTKKLGATHMTGGVNQFYTDLGYNTICFNVLWEK
ncbi:MAG: N-acetyltransferase [Herbinix sp.]|nr:N-acetyltransferase [Herbinix sp.]